jgi:hypothetical protein
MSRQVVFGADNRPIVDVPGDEDVIDRMMEVMSEEEDLPLIERLR